MRKQVAIAIAAAVLAVAGTVPAAAAMGEGPGHDLPNEPGVNVLAHADTADYSLAFTAHTSRSGDAHGSIEFVDGDVAITKLDLRRLAFMDEETAASGGCSHGAMVIARGTALYNGTEPVKVWVDLQDREDGDRARIRAMALTDHDGHDDGGDEHATDGHTDGHEDGTDGHDGCGEGGSPWLYRSHWLDVRDVAVHVKGYGKD